MREVSNAVSIDLAPSLVGIQMLEPAGLAATRAAAIAALMQVGRGDPLAADAAASEAMRAALSHAPGRGTVVIGEGEKDEAPMLANGEEVGDGRGPRFDVAVDPLECTKACAAGLPGSLATIAFAEPDTLWSPGPAFYMEKLVVGAQARDAIDLTASPESNAAAVAGALGKEIGDLRVVVLDKPRHAELIARLRGVGARVSAPTDGDVAGALAAVLPQAGVDLLMGVGGTPEGVMSACAARALGGGMEGRLAPQRPAESNALRDTGVDLERVLQLEDLVAGESFFVATGVTDGALVRGPRRAGEGWLTESLVVGRGTVRRVLETSLEANERTR